MIRLLALGVIDARVSDDCQSAENKKHSECRETLKIGGGVWLPRWVTTCQGHGGKYLAFSGMWQLSTSFLRDYYVEPGGEWLVRDVPIASERANWTHKLLTDSASTNTTLADNGCRQGNL